MFDAGTNKAFYLYFALISIVSVIITVYDKCISKKRGAMRVPEAALLLFSFAGGSLAMFATMLFIRHKTKHTKFMLGIPLIMLLQISAIIFISIK